MDLLGRIYWVHLAAASGRHPSLAGAFRTQVETPGDGFPLGILSGDSFYEGGSLK